MTNLVQHIQGASEPRSTHLGELRAGANRLLGEFRTAHQGMDTELRRKLKTAEKARVEEAQGFMRKNIGVRVSELRSDAHNLLQRFQLEHRDMGRARRGKLGAGEKARVGAARQRARQRQAAVNELHVNTQTLREKFRKTNADRQQALGQTLDELAADRRRAGGIWREGLKKKSPVA
jgi:hypothetical protein